MHICISENKYIDFQSEVVSIKSHEYFQQKSEIVGGDKESCEI